MTKSNITKNLLINSLMISGKKSIGEKILIKTCKKIQKEKIKSHKQIIKTAIIKNTPPFKIHKQTIKKGKRKTEKKLPYIITLSRTRILESIKYIISSSKKQKKNKFYKQFNHELTNIIKNNKSHSLEKKQEIQKQVFLNKRYLSKFKWK